MICIKLDFFIKENGVSDYKGLDLKFIVPGTQVYPEDRNIAFLKYTGDLVEHKDIEQITEDQYLTKVKEYNDYIDEIVTPEKEIEALKQSQADQDAFLLDLDFRQSMSEMGL